MENWPDQKIRKLSVRYIEKASMDPVSWRFTLIGKAHPALSGVVKMQAGELPIVSSFISENSWYLFTTRRVVGTYQGQKVELASVDCTRDSYGNFKGYGKQETEVMTLNHSGDEKAMLEFETGKASMAPIYYFRFWSIKYPVLVKFRG